MRDDRPNLPVFLEVTAVQELLPREWDRRTLTRYLDRCGVLFKRDKGTRALIDVYVLKEKLFPIWKRLHDNR